MFWNEPNLYGYTYREVPNVPTPFFGQLPKFPFLGTTPWTTPQLPPTTPFFGMNLRETLPVPTIHPLLAMQYLQNLPQLQVPFLSQIPQVPQIPQIPQIPQFNPLAFYGLPYRSF